MNVRLTSVYSFSRCADNVVPRQICHDNVGFFFEISQKTTDSDAILTDDFHRQSVNNENPEYEVCRWKENKVISNVKEFPI